MAIFSLYVLTISFTDPLVTQKYFFLNFFKYKNKEDDSICMYVMENYQIIILILLILLTFGR